MRIRDCVGREGDFIVLKMHLKVEARRSAEVYQLLYYNRSRSIE